MWLADSVASANSKSTIPRPTAGARGASIPRALHHAAAVGLKDKLYGRLVVGVTEPERGCVWPSLAYIAEQSKMAQINRDPRAPHS